jgi:hypothetical protein
MNARFRVELIDSLSGKGMPTRRKGMPDWAFSNNETGLASYSSQSISYLNESSRLRIEYKMRIRIRHSIVELQMKRHCIDWSLVIKKLKESRRGEKVKEIGSKKQRKVQVQVLVLAVLS